MGAGVLRRAGLGGVRNEQPIAHAIEWAQLASGMLKGAGRQKSKLTVHSWHGRAGRRLQAHAVRNASQVPAAALHRPAFTTEPRRLSHLHTAPQSAPPRYSSTAHRPTSRGSTLQLGATMGYVRCVRCVAGSRSVGHRLGYVSRVTVHAACDCRCPAAPCRTST